MPANDIEGKIAAILSSSKVVINKGSNDGVEQGDFFYIYSEQGPFEDPDTKKSLGTTRQYWGKVLVKSIEKRFCIAETEIVFRNPFRNLAILFGETTEKARLPIDESQIWKGVEKVEVGFRAMLVKQVAVDSQDDEESEDEDYGELDAIQPSLLGPAITDDDPESGV